jgi:hypothetical protein
MASSTTSPTASTSPKSESVLVENPTAGKNRNAPTSETGMVRMGIKVARQLCRKTKTTITTRPIASSSVFTISFAPSVTAAVVSSTSVDCRSGGNFLASSAMVAFARLAAASAFDPGFWWLHGNWHGGGGRARTSGGWCPAPIEARC